MAEDSTILATFAKGNFMNDDLSVPWRTRLSSPSLIIRGGRAEKKTIRKGMCVVVGEKNGLICPGEKGHQT